MSEYMEKHAVSKLIGAPPGYVGFGDGQAGSGLLTNAVETHPHCVLLLDEIEKAHPDLFNILLQVMDDGRLTNGAGKTVDFKNLILIMTSNAGAREMSKNALGFGREKITGEDDKAVNTLFAPEFINRLDAVVKFNNIKPGTMSKIVDKFLAQLNVLSADKNVKVEVAPTAKEWLAKKGYEPKYGARPLARVMQKHIKIPLSREILFGKLKHGGTAVIVLDGDDLKIEVVTDILATLDTGSAPVLVE
jgi:ATP-dependent Clp protease ATP-binding subunit ClpA